MSRSLASPALVALMALVVGACSAPSREYFDPNADGGGSGGQGTGGAGGGNNGGGGSGTGGSGTGGTGIGGAGDAGVTGHPGMDIVTSGNVMQSANFKLLLTVGQGPGGNGVMKSTNFALKSGLPGATQP